ncbi:MULTISPECIES: hypothetical protein [unclassified Paenibacillus]|uniref:hypothetical protein n=1 Tax=unclassified Paenibacillus TaxID=185978 RepID=UPI003640953C
MNTGPNTDEVRNKGQAARSRTKERTNVGWRSVSTALVVTSGDCSGMQPTFEATVPTAARLPIQGA